MAEDPVRVAETRAWMVKAASDLRAASHDLKSLPPLSGDTAFHCQQAVEKALKGFLAWHDCPFRKTHSLEELGEQCLQLDPTLKSLVDIAVPLTEYAWKFRYPGEPEEPSVQEVQEALDLAIKFYEAILTRLPHEARP